MEYQVQFGTMNAPKPHSNNKKKFRIAVLGDFSARGNRQEISDSNAIASRKAHFVKHDNLDELLTRLEVKLRLPAGPSGATIEVPIRSMDDFHPDQLVVNVPLFEKLQSLRTKLLDPATFERAASAVRALALPSSTTISRSSRNSLSCNVPRTRLENFADLLNVAPSQHEPAELKTLLRDAVEQHVVSSMTGQSELVEGVDLALSGLMRTLLHHPDFQALESLWRSLDLLIRRVELDEGVEVVLHDIHAAEFAADVSRDSNLSNTGVFQWIVEQPTQQEHLGSYSVIIGNYQWERIPPHIELLARASKIAGAAQACFLTSIDKSCIRTISEKEETPRITQEAWNQLRELPSASYLGLMSPRFLLRWPYGKKTDPIDAFAFEEFSNQSGMKSMLWGNTAFLAAISLAQTFVMDGLDSMKLDSHLTIDDMPIYYFNDQYGDQIALPCTEVLINVALAQKMTQSGIIPALSLQGRPEVRIGGLNSVRGQSLAGPWNPVDTEIGDSLESSTTTPQNEPIAETPALDAEIPALDPVTEPVDAPPALDDELNALLSSLEADDQTETATNEQAAIDPELEALLADL